MGRIIGAKGLLPKRVLGCSGMGFGNWNCRKLWRWLCRRTGLPSGCWRNSVCAWNDTGCFTIVIAPDYPPSDNRLSENTAIFNFKFAFFVVRNIPALIRCMPSKVMSSDSPRKCAGALALPWFPSRPAAKGTQRFAFGDWQGYYASRFADVYESWPLDTANLFLSPRFLASEEEGLPALLRPRYLVLENDRGPFAWVALQVVTFRALDNIRDQEVWKGLWGKTKRFFARFGNYRILICGHLFIPGEHGWHVQGTEATRQAFLRQLGPMLKRIARHEGASVVLCKDFEEPLPFAAEGGLHELSFQPNMIFDLRPQWKTVDDYLDAMSSKYRIRARRAFKKSEGLRFKELSFVQIKLLAGE